MLVYNRCETGKRLGLTFFIGMSPRKEEYIMKIKVIGKQHMKGTSKKTGQPYDFVALHFNAPARGVEGTAAQTVNIDPALIPFDRIAIGGEYDLELDLRGYVVAVDPVSKS